MSKTRWLKIRNCFEIFNSQILQKQKNPSNFSGISGLVSWDKLFIMVSTLDPFWLSIAFAYTLRDTRYVPWARRWSWAVTSRSRPRARLSAKARCRLGSLCTRLHARFARRTRFRPYRLEREIKIIFTMSSDQRGLLDRFLFWTAVFRLLLHFLFWAAVCVSSSIVKIAGRQWRKLAKD